MGQPSRLLKSCLFAILAIVLSVFTSPAWAAEWLTEFKVIQESPDPDQGVTQKIKGYLNDLLTDDDLQEKKRLADQAWSRLVEGYLRDIAKRFKAAGLLPPANMPVIEEDGKKKYVVYLFDFKGSTSNKIYSFNPNWLGVAGNYRCHDTPYTYLAINKESFSYTGKKVAGVSLEEYLYGTLAHEFFHTIQYSYDIKYGSTQMCGSYSNVVVEGMAEAAAGYVTNKRWPTYLRKYKAADAVGVYPYKDYFLQQPPSGDVQERNPYRTSSFWRNLAERNGGLAFLGHLLKQPAAKDLSADKVLDWLQQGLKSWPRHKLEMYTVFPAFLTEFTGSADIRYGNKTIVSRYEYWNDSRLTTQVFGTCLEEELTPAKPVISLDYPKLNKIAGKCVLIRWKGFLGKPELGLEAHSQSRSLLDQVHLGVARAKSTDIRGWDRYYNCYNWLRKSGHYNNPLASCEYEKSFISTGPTPGTYVKRWVGDPEVFSSVQGEILFVLTNIARNSKKTSVINDAQDSDVEFRVGMKYTKSKSKNGQRRPMSAPKTQQLRVPNLGKMDETTYGINKSKPIKAGSNLPGFIVEVPQVEDKSKDVPPAVKYSVSPLDKQPITSGYKGPLYGMVAAEYDNKYQNRPVTSMLCLSPNKDRIGRVLQADEKIMVIHVKSDLCLMPTKPNQRPKVVDHLDATLTLPFGWRYFIKTAPIDIVTPGTRFYINRYQQRLARMGMPEVRPGNGLKGSTETSGTTGAGASPGSGVGVSRQACQCTCDEFEKIQALGKEGGAEEKRQIMRYAPCTKRCLSAYMRCGLKKLRGQ